MGKNRGVFRAVPSAFLCAFLGAAMVPRFAAPPAARKIPRLPTSGCSGYSKAKWLTRASVLASLADTACSARIHMHTHGPSLKSSLAPAPRSTTTKKSCAPAMDFFFCLGFPCRVSKARCRKELSAHTHGMFLTLFVCEKPCQNKHDCKFPSMTSFFGPEIK